MSEHYAILVVDDEGEDLYVCDGIGDTPSKFSLSQARTTLGFIEMGLEEYQRAEIVPYPKKSKRGGQQ